MSLPEVTTREDWLAARRALLTREKELTRLRDELSADRRRLPMVAVDKEYVFEGAHGKATLLDMFDGRRQLVLQHVMYGPDWDTACPGCTAGLDEMSQGVVDHLRSRDTTFVCVSRAAYPKLAAYAESRGWLFPWYSSLGSDFNYDFHATLDESVAPVEYNYRTRDEHVRAGSGDERLGVESSEVPGVSCFLRDGDRVFHTYSTWARGTDQLGSAYTWLDLTALGRQEDWEEPSGRAERVHGADPTFSD
jgi:predicted dithiol-disulfide oxidoreductase (DUF899 family)